jgi:AcrR family transcriptional regulator
MAAASLGRIAAVAEVDKAMVVYYFGSREALLAQVVKWMGERAAEQASAALAQVSSLLDPRRVSDVGVEALWTASLTVPELPRAYMALLSGSRDEEVRKALAELKATFIGIFHNHVDAIEAQGYRLLGDQTGFVTTAFAFLRGLILEWAEDGDTPQLRAGLDEFKKWASSSFIPVRAVPVGSAGKSRGPAVTRRGRAGR